MFSCKRLAVFIALLNIRFTSRALRELNALAKNDRARVLAALERVAEGAPNADIKKLKTGDNQFRLRVGPLRVLYTLFRSDAVVHKIAERDQAYT